MGDDDEARKRAEKPAAPSDFRSLHTEPSEQDLADMLAKAMERGDAAAMMKINMKLQDLSIQRELTDKVVGKSGDLIRDLLKDDPIGAKSGEPG